MIGHVLILSLFLIGADGPRGAADVAGSESAADRITLRDGSVVLGLVTSATSGARGSVEFLVRRDWAEKNLADHLARWDHANVPAVRRAVEQRRKRLADWRKERAASPGIGPDDRIVQWIDRELNRLANSEDLVRSTLVRVRLPRSEVQKREQRPSAVERWLRLAWLSALPDPETMPLDELKNALEARGYSPDGAGNSPPASLDRLLPPVLETDAAWLGRRAATELAIDPDLRFLRFQDMVIPDVQPGAQAMNAMGLNTAISELKRLLDPDQAQGRPDPLFEKLQAVAARGRIGAVVTRLAIAPDLSEVTVELSLWVRTGGNRWVPFGSRTATVRPDGLPPEAVQNLAADPQVKSGFQIVEMLGLGAVPQEFKDRSLRMGAATQSALNSARSAFNQDLDAMALPVLEPAPDRNARNRQAPQPTAKPEPQPVRKPAPRRRSVLGPPER